MAFNKKGAIIGGVIAGPAGAAIGGYASDMFSGGKNYGFSKGDLESMYANRGNEINDFEAKLEGLRSEYLAQIPALNQATFAAFGKNAAATMGAHGVGMNSGAFAGALAKAALPIQRGMYDTAYSTGVSSAEAVNAARGQRYGAMMGAESAGMSAPAGNPWAAGLGRLAGQGALMGLGAAIGGPAGAAAGSQVGRVLMPANTGTGMAQRELGPGGW